MQWEAIEHMVDNMADKLSRRITELERLQKEDRQTLWRLEDKLNDLAIQLDYLKRTM